MFNRPIRRLNVYKQKASMQPMSFQEGINHVNENNPRPFPNPTLSFLSGDSEQQWQRGHGRLRRRDSTMLLQRHHQTSLTLLLLSSLF